MTDKIRKILGGMSAAGLIVAGSLPLMANSGNPPTNCTRSKTGKAASDKVAKTKATAPKNVKATAPKATPEKANSTKAKTAK